MKPEFQFVDLTQHQNVVLEPFVVDVVIVKSRIFLTEKVRNSKYLDMTFLRIILDLQGIFIYRKSLPIRPGSSTIYSVIKNDFMKILIKAFSSKNLQKIYINFLWMIFKQFLFEIFERSSVQIF